MLFVGGFVGRCSVLGVRCSMFGVRCSIFGIRCSMFDVRCSMFDVRGAIQLDTARIALSDERDIKKDN